MTEKLISDVVIIGGGPAGLYSCFYAGLRDLSVTLLEAQEDLGGRLSFYPEKFVWDIGALDATQGIDVKKSLIKQANVFKPKMVVNFLVERFFLQQVVELFSRKKFKLF
jgi:thioredoxin reductase (NADPH)